MYGGSAAAVYDTYVDGMAADPHRPGPPDDGASLDDIGRRMYRR
ncbi:hypothetical protein [Corynebacterium maris]|nr:hypothetical protein [Corynebacterium maris]